MSREKTLAVVTKAIEFINSLNDKEFEKLLSGEYEFSLKQTKTTVKKETKASIAKDNVYEEYVKAIYSSNTRNEAKEFIESLELTKDKLLTLAKYLSVQVNKKSKKDDIVDRIVEVIVGGKLRREVLGDKS